MEVKKEELLSTAMDAAVKAGELLKKGFGKALQIEEKQPNDFVTEMDLASERVIKEILSDKYPNSSFISEELSPEILQKGLVWVVDPIDGTKNYIQGFPFVCVSIAAMIDGELVAGVVYDFIRGDMFHAVKGAGAYLNQKPIRVSGREGLRGAMIGTGFPFRAKKFLDIYLESFKRVFSIASAVRRAGSAALDLCYTACGIFDGFWEIGLSIWDVAAASLILEEAGGIVSDFDGERKFLYTGNIVGATPGVYRELFPIVSAILGGEVLRDLNTRG